MARTVVDGTEMRGAHLVAEDKVILVFGVGNLDPDRFDDPTYFWIGREKSHIAFVSGPHRCVSEHLAMVEMWGSDAVRRGIRTLPVRFTPVTR